MPGDKGIMFSILWDLITDKGAKTMSYTTKTDFWGNTSYYDEKGRLIGKGDTTWFGTKVIKDQNGNVIGRPVRDEYNRETIELEKTSLFGFSSSKRTVLKEGELEDWEMCGYCGEYFDGEDDEYCQDCLHDHF